MNIQYKRSERLHFAAFQGSQSYFAFLFLLPSTVAFLFKSISYSFLIDRLFEMSDNLLSISTFLGRPVKLVNAWDFHPVFSPTFHKPLPFITRNWKKLACGAGVFFERAICSQKRHVETKGYYFYSPQSSTVIKSKMAATTILRTRTGHTNKVSPTQNIPALQARKKSVFFLSTRFRLLLHCSVALNCGCKVVN